MMWALASPDQATRTWRETVSSGSLSPLEIPSVPKCPNLTRRASKNRKGKKGLFLFCAWRWCGIATARPSSRSVGTRSQYHMVSELRLGCRVETKSFQISGMISPQLNYSMLFLIWSLHDLGTSTRCDIKHLAMNEEDRKWQVFAFMQKVTWPSGLFDTIWNWKTCYTIINNVNRCFTV